MDTSNVVLNGEPSANGNNNRNRNNRRQMSRRDDYKSSKPSTRFDYDNSRNRTYERQRDYYPVGPPPPPPPSRLPMPRFSDHHNYHHQHNQYNHHNLGYGPMPGPYLPPPPLPLPLPLLQPPRPQQFDDISHVGQLPPPLLPPPSEPATFSDRRFGYRGVPYPFMNEGPRRPEFPPRNRPPRRAVNIETRNNRSTNYHPRQNELNSKKIINNEHQNFNDKNPIVNVPPPLFNINFDNDIIENNFCEFESQGKTINSNLINRPNRY